MVGADMFTDVKKNCNEINELIRELETYEGYKEQLEKDLAALEKKYQIGTYSYNQYAILKSRLLGGKTKERIFNYYNAYVLSLIREIDLSLIHI